MLLYSSFLNRPNTFSLFLLLCLNVFAQGQNNLPINIVYTGNLNCALDDCNCSDSLVGGFTRVMTKIKELRKQYPDIILVDAGDYLNSYSFPEANMVMLKMLSKANYQVLNMGDQEFIESWKFLQSAKQKYNLKLPFFSGNIQFQNPQNLFSEGIKILNHQNVKIVLLSLTDIETFNTMSKDNLLIVPPAKVLSDLDKAYIGEKDLQILLFHGKWESAQRLLRSFPWIDVVILAHNQKKEYLIQSHTILVESGFEGEYIGRLEIVKKDTCWVFRNEFIPIIKDVPIDSDVKKLVESYYQQLKN